MSDFTRFLPWMPAWLALGVATGCYSEAELRSLAPMSSDTQRELAEPEACFVEREVCLAEVDAVEASLSDDEIGPAYDACHDLYELCLASPA